ncbi:MAG: 16S rRNA (cytosine(1402)-N(4))-methyltransferase RsmH [Clostridia bacterium]|nr:16S rRNA (cytosine(1402)-N(4))-methyltransferase RsmH [Clostridia bacterium]
MTTLFEHKPVMLKECLDGLNVKDGGVYFDGTVGGGGHSYEILRRSSPSGRLIATDLDSEAINAAQSRLSEFGGRFEIYKSNYKRFEEVFSEANVDKVDGVLLDFGVSSHQLDKEMRGFSYMKHYAPLDMRMDTKAYLTAEIVVNGYPEDKLYRIIRDYGEERFAANIARNVVKYREKQRITTCGQLVEIIEKSIPKKFQLGAPCARKTFQAIRIEVNGELEGLYDCVVGLSRRLKKGGRIAILTFHSLEDRIVKNAFRDLEQDCICDKSIPVCVCGKVKELEVVTKKPILPSEAEMEDNSRSRCAKLRIAERII